MPSIIEVLFKLLRILNHIKLPYMLVGGFAVNYYGVPRATGDIDISILIDSENIHDFLKTLKKNNFAFHQKEVLTLVKLSNRFMIFSQSSAYRVDCWIPKTNYETNALQRRVKVKMAGRNFYLPTCEDLILLKILAGREKDREDLKWIIKRQKANLDKKYLKFWSIALNIHKELNKLLSLK